jgi:hypothetical protein
MRLEVLAGVGPNLMVTDPRTAKDDRRNRKAIVKARCWEITPASIRVRAARDAGAPHSQHLGHSFLGSLNFSYAYNIADTKQPSREALAETVGSVAGGRFLSLGQNELLVSHDRLAKFLVFPYDPAGRIYID